MAAGAAAGHSAACSLKNAPADAASILLCTGKSSHATVFQNPALKGYHQYGDHNKKTDRSSGRGQ